MSEKMNGISHGEPHSFKQHKKSVVLAMNDQLRAENSFVEKSQFPNWLMAATGLYIKNGTGGRKYDLLDVLRVSFIFSVALYQNAFHMYYMVSKKSFNGSTIGSLVLVNWMMQKTIAMSRGYVAELLRNIDFSEECKQLIRRTLRTSLLIAAAMLSIAMTTSYLALSGTFKFDSYDIGTFNAFGAGRYRIFSVLCHVYAFYCWASVLTFYTLIGRILLNELNTFNQSLKMIGHKKKSSEMVDVSSELIERYTTHVDLARKVRLVNNTFEVYAFALIGINIPTTIFTLLAFFLAVQSNSWLNVFWSSTDIIFCTLALIGLTAVPAKVHSAVRDVESIIYSNSKIWTPFNDKVYQLASVFIAHAKQPNLGYTLWGFAVVTKPLILTTISLTITYLTFIMQLKYGDDPCSNH